MSTKDKTITIPKEAKNYTYDDWLEFFRAIPTTILLDQQEDFKKKIPVEGYAALSRWLEIIDNPSKMDKLYQGRIKAQNTADIMEIAVGDDDEAFWMALIRENVSQLNSSTSSPQEVARLTQNLGIFRDKLHEIRARKPKKGSTLEKVLAAALKSDQESPKSAENPAKPKQKNAKKSPKTLKSAKKAKEPKQERPESGEKLPKSPKKPKTESKTEPKPESAQNGKKSPQNTPQTARQKPLPAKVPKTAGKTPETTQALPKDPTQSLAKPPQAPKMSVGAEETENG